MARSIYRSKKFAPLIHKLRTADAKSDAAVFPHIKDVQVYAALLGFANGRREPVDRKDAENIEWHTFDNDGLTHYIYLIALAETKDMNILRYDEQASELNGASDDMVKIFEEYAEGGFGILESWLAKNPGDPYGAKAMVEGLRRSGFLTHTETEAKFDEVKF